VIPKVVYTLNGIEKEITFIPADYSEFLPEWIRDEVEYKNPFTGKKKWKKRGYYFRALITFEGLPYSQLDDYVDIWNKAVDDLKFYPNRDVPEFFTVDSNEKFAYADSHTANAVLDFELEFRGKDRFDSPLSYGYDFWGDRRHTFTQEATEVY